MIKRLHAPTTFILIALQALILSLSINTQAAEKSGDQLKLGPIEKIPSGEGTLILNGLLTEAAWKQARTLKLQVADSNPRTALPPSHKTVVNILHANGWLIMGFECAEPGGRISARTVGVERNIWGEDHIEGCLQWKNTKGKDHWIHFAVNPLGALWSTRPSSLSARSATTANGWSCEIAISLEALGIPKDLATPTLQANFGRTRQPRPYQPQEESAWVPADKGKITKGEGLLELTKLNAKETPTPRMRFLLLAPKIRADTGVVVPVHRPALKQLPEPNPIYWNQAARFHLHRPNGDPRQPEHRTQVLVKQDQKVLQILCVCQEEDTPMASKTERDGNIWSGDIIEIALGLPGSNYVHVAINPAGSYWDDLGSGKRGTWNGPLEVTAKMEPDKKRWMVAVSFPLKDIARALNADASSNIWQLQVSRTRPANMKSRTKGAAALRHHQRPETSIWPVTHTEEFHALGRFATLALEPGQQKPDANTGPALRTVHRDDPWALRKSMRLGHETLPSRLDVSNVFSPKTSQEKNLPASLQAFTNKTIAKQNTLWKKRWDQLEVVASKAASGSDQDRVLFAKASALYFDQIKAHLHNSLGKWPTRSSLKIVQGSAVTLHGIKMIPLVFESRPRFPVTANLYLPAKITKKIPAFVALPAHHYTAFQRPKGHVNHVALGVHLARSGCALLVLDHVGMDERTQYHAWAKQAKQRYAMGMQLSLLGESVAMWQAYDASRAADVLLTFQNIDSSRLGIIGAVAGGGDLSALAASLDERFSISIPFNFGGAWVSPLSYEPTRILRGSVAGGYLAWALVGSRAPRPFIMAREFLFNPETSESWKRLQTLYQAHQAPSNLAFQHGTKNSHAGNYGGLHRKPIYVMLQKWWGLPALEDEIKISRNEIDPWVLRRQDIRKKASFKKYVTLQQLAANQAEKILKETRKTKQKLTLQQQRAALRLDLEKCFNLKIQNHPYAKKGTIVRTRKVETGATEWIEIDNGDDTPLPAILMRPPSSQETKPPVIVGACQHGKGRFLLERAAEIEKLITAGFAVLLVDVRGTGETAPDYSSNPEGMESILAQRLWMASQSLLGLRLRDFRTAIAYASARPDLDGKRIGLWGESFSKVNPESMLVDELPFRASSPQIQYQAEPLGPLLVTLAALYDSGIKSVYAKGGLASFQSILQDPYFYIPTHIITPGLLKAGDVTDWMRLLTGQKLCLVDWVDGRNRLLKGKRKKERWAPVIKSFKDVKQTDSFQLDPEKLKVEMFFTKTTR